MKKIMLITGIFFCFSTVTFAQRNFKILLSCKANELSVNSFTIFVDESDLIGWTGVDFNYVNGKSEIWGVNPSIMTDLEVGKVTLKSDENVQISLEQNKNEYYLIQKENNIEKSTMLQCQ
jgi:hypothetical protein